MNYLNKNHEKNYLELLSVIGSKVKYTEYASACYILALPEIYLKVKLYISENGIDYDEILSKDYSSSELFFIHISKVLFKSQHNPDLYLSDFLLLDKDLYMVFISALNLARQFSF